MGTIAEDLIRPENLPDPTEDVELVQTHISLIFRGRDYVYKIKKPVNFGFLDFSSLEKRAFFCRREVELNRRFSKDLYLGVLPVFWDGRCHTLTAGRGEVCDYAVRMRRISDDALMDAVFSKGALTEHNLNEIAVFLSRFHMNAEAGKEIEKFGEPQNFRVNTDENFCQIEPFIGITVSRELFSRLKAWTEDFYQRYAELFRERIKAKRIRDCHGDLHMQHICLTNPVQAFDCIEFNDRFRYGDTLADIAFLIMDLEFRGGGKEAAALWGIYKNAAREGTEAEPLLTFYKVYRAIVRAKVIGFKARDPVVKRQDRDESAQKAGLYFELADSYIT